jgi:hypothetical protein
LGCPFARDTPGTQYYGWGRATEYRYRR